MKTLDNRTRTLRLRIWHLEVILTVVKFFYSKLDEILHFYNDFHLVQCHFSTRNWSWWTVAIKYDPGSLAGNFTNSWKICGLRFHRRSPSTLLAGIVETGVNGPMREQTCSDWSIVSICSRLEATFTDAKFQVYDPEFDQRRHFHHEYHHILTKCLWWTVPLLLGGLVSTS
jgi:hypothetical protein